MSEAEVKSEIKERRDFSIGIFTIVAFVLLFCGWAWFKSFPISKPPQRFKIAFTNVAGLNNNAAVYIDGVRIGAVEKIDWRAKRRVIVSVKINKEDLFVPVGSNFEILTNGLVGAKYIEITLPERGNGQLEPLTPDMVAEGEEPVRMEVVLNDVVVGLSQVDFDALQMSVRNDMRKVGHAAENLAALSRKLEPVAERALVVEHKVASVADSLRGTTQRVNRIIDNPKFTSDLKQIAAKAESAADKIKSTVESVNTTLADKELRADLLFTMTKLSESTENIKTSVASVHSLVQDREVRVDVRETIAKANAAMTQLNNLLDKPTITQDIKETLGSAKEALSNANLVARQLNQILDKRFPLLQMIIGRPGRLPSDDARSALKDNHRM